MSENIREIAEKYSHSLAPGLVEAGEYIYAEVKALAADWLRLTAPLGDIPALLQEVRRLTAAREADRQEIAGLKVEALKEERMSVQLVDERDAAENAFGELAALLRVETEYSNLRGYEQIHNDCADVFDKFRSRIEEQGEEIGDLKMHVSDREYRLAATEMALGQKDAEIAGLRDALEQAKNDFEAIAYDHGFKAEAEHQTAETLRETWQRTFDTAMDGRGKIEDAINESLAAVPPAPASEGEKA